MYAKGATNEERKKRREKAAFLRFARASGLPLTPGSVTQPEPPGPDIECRVSGFRQAFELTQMAEQGMANDVGAAINATARTGEARPACHAYSDEVAVIEAVRRKQLTGYTGAWHMELLVYTDGVLHPPGVSAAQAQAALATLPAAITQQWQRIRVFDYAQRRVAY